MQHFKNPQNYGQIENPDIKIKHHNPLCGDEQEWYFLFNKKNKDKNKWKIEEVRFTGSGCAISTASASILSEYIKGKTIDDIEKISTDEILAMMGLKSISSSRVKCVNLALTSVKKALKSI